MAEELSKEELKRRELHETLCGILGNRHVYFQPTSNVRMVYPAIVYSKTTYNESFANNGKYKLIPKYSITVISEDPTNSIGEKIAKLPMCSAGTRYMASNLYHDPFYIYL